MTEDFMRDFFGLRRRKPKEKTEPKGETGLRSLIGAEAKLIGLSTFPYQIRGNFDTEADVVIGDVDGCMLQVFNALSWAKRESIWINTATIKAITNVRRR